MKSRAFFLLLYWCACLCASGTASAATYKPDGDIIGESTTYRVQKHDSLYAIARKFDLGIVELMAANPSVTQETLKAGKNLVIPAARILPPVREGIVINLPELRLFYFAPDNTVMTYPITIGREGWQTPTGSTSIILKRENPTWTPTDKIREEDPNLPDVIPAGPNNPLGLYALTLGWPGYLIHGTNHPLGLGRRASHGCIRLYPEDIEALFSHVEVGVPVTVMDAPYKLGWKTDSLWLEVTPTQAEGDAIMEHRQLLPVSAATVHDIIQRTAANIPMAIDWPAVENAMNSRNGIPVMAGRIERP